MSQESSAYTDCALNSTANPSNTLNLSSAPPLCPWGVTLHSHSLATEVDDSAIVKHSPEECREHILRGSLGGNFLVFFPLCEVFTQADL